MARLKRILALLGLGELFHILRTEKALGSVGEFSGPLAKNGAHALGDRPPQADKFFGRGNGEFIPETGQKRRVELGNSSEWMSNFRHIPPIISGACTGMSSSAGTIGLKAEVFPCWLSGLA